jgi:hypothetical protein
VSKLKQERVDETVIENEICFSKDLGTADCDQAGISGTGADEPDFAEAGHSKSRRWK